MVCSEFYIDVFLMLHPAGFFFLLSYDVFQCQLSVSSLSLLSVQQQPLPRPLPLPLSLSAVHRELNSPLISIIGLHCR